MQEVVLFVLFFVFVFLHIANIHRFVVSPSTFRLESSRS